MGVWFCCKGYLQHWWCNLLSTRVKWWVYKNYKTNIVLLKLLGRSQCGQTLLHDSHIGSKTCLFLSIKRYNPNKYDRSLVNNDINDDLLRGNLDIMPYALQLGLPQWAIQVAVGWKDFLSWWVGNFSTWHIRTVSWMASCIQYNCCGSKSILVLVILIDCSLI